MGQPALVVIDTGDPPSLAALCLQRDPSSTIQWCPSLAGDPDEDARRRAVGRHHEVLQTAVLLHDTVESTEPLCDARALLAACSIAVGHGCRAVVWPVCVGPDFDDVRPVLDLVSHVTGITALAGGEILIETPLLDLAPEQVVDLIRQHHVPTGLSWPYADPAGASLRATPWLEATEKQIGVM